MSRFAAKIAALEVEAAALDHELQHTPPDKLGQIKARLGAVQRQLRWYRTRDTGQPLGVGVADHVGVGEAY